MAPDAARLTAAILNAAWMVRHYQRGGRTAIQREQRDEAIRQLGITVRDAFNTSEDFESLLTAVYQGLAPKDAPPF